MVSLTLVVKRDGTLWPLTLAAGAAQAGPAGGVWEFRTVAMEDFVHRFQNPSFGKSDFAGRLGLGYDYWVMWVGLMVDSLAFKDYGWMLIEGLLISENLFLGAGNKQPYVAVKS